MSKRKKQSSASDVMLSIWFSASVFFGVFVFGQVFYLFCFVQSGIRFISHLVEYNQSKIVSEFLLESLGSHSEKVLKKASQKNARSNIILGLAILSCIGLVVDALRVVSVFTQAVLPFSFYLYVGSFAFSAFLNAVKARGKFVRLIEQEKWKESTWIERAALFFCKVGSSVKEILVSVGMGALVYTGALSVLLSFVFSFNPFVLGVVGGGVALGGLSMVAWKYGFDLGRECITKVKSFFRDPLNQGALFEKLNTSVDEAIKEAARKEDKKAVRLLGSSQQGVPACRFFKGGRRQGGAIERCERGCCKPN